MHYTTALAALVGFGSLVAAAPAHNHQAKARHVVERADNNKNSTKNGNNNNSNKNNNNNNNNSNKNNNNNNNNGATVVIIEQTVLQPQITIVEENLDLVSQLALTAEQEFSALVQAQLALVQEVETIKNNIRINHFLSRFSQVNTVIVCVTEVVDLRGGSKGRNSRYMVNQLLADNGLPESQVVVMLTAASPVTINAAQPTLDLSGLLGANASALPTGVVASVVAAASASAAAAAPSSAASGNATAAGLNFASFDPSNPLGQINQTVILPYGSKAPSLPNGAQIVSDPASIILPNQRNLLVEDITQFSQDCALFSSNSLSLFNLQSSVLQEAAAIAALEASGLSLGSASGLNAAVAALLGSAAGSSVNVGTAAVSAAATTASAAAVASTSSSASSSTSAVAASAAASTSAAVAAAAAVVSSAAPAAAAPAASAAADAAGGVGVQIVPIPAAA